MNDGIVIVGAGPAGVRAALSARSAGFDGTVRIVAADGAGEPYERPPLSKWTEAFKAEIKPLVPAGQLDAARIDWLNTTATAIDPGAKKLTLADGAALGFDKLLLATGAAARRFPENIFPGAPILYLRDRADADRLARRAREAGTALIIGGGFIGLELAASLRRSELAVTVLEAAELLLSRGVPAAIANVVQALHATQGVRIRCSAQIERIVRAGKATEVTLADGEHLSADIVIGGIGAKPETTLAEAAGLTVDDGIVVNASLQTSHPDIFAAGDCCAAPFDGARLRLESWQTAGQQGETAGRNMVAPDGDVRPCHIIPWLWSEQYDHTLQVAGHLGTEDERVVRRLGDDHVITFGRCADGTLTFACGIAPGAKIAKDIRFAMRLMERKTKVQAADLTSPDVDLKSLARK